MKLADVTSAPQGGGSWSDVIEASTDRIGANPRAVWIDALEQAGSAEGKQDLSSEEFTTRCPAHDDGKASLRWREEADGQILFTCRADCDGEAVIKAVGLRWNQLKWSKTQYLYRDQDRRLMAVHVKTATKSFSWLHPATEREIEQGVDVGRDGLCAGRGTDWVTRLWMWPDLVERSDQARARGHKIHLWLSEGERDTEHVTRAIEAGWGVERGDEADEWVDLVTTAPDGVSWGPELSADLLRLGAARVTILADNDPGGVGRANKIVAGLQQEMSASGVRTELEAFGWLISGVKDATDAIIRWGRGWLSKAIAVADADEYAWASHRTGWLFETEAIDKDGAGTGELALGRIVFGPKGHRTEVISTGPVRVRAVLIDEQGVTEGWELDVGSGGTSRECILRTRDLAGNGLGAWNAREGGGLFIISARAIAEAFGAYLRHHGSRAPKVLCYEHEGWVTDEVFVAATGVIVNNGVGTEAIGAKVERVAGLWHFGLDGPDGEIGAAQRLCDILSFRDADESGPLLSWLAGVAARPYALRGVGAGAVPVLQCVGTSGHGKTRFLELACRLFGLKNSAIGATTGPGLIRVLASSTAVVWVDDASLDEYQQNLLRGSVTGGGRTRGNIDGDKGVTTDKSVAAVLYSAEAGFRLNEKAMRERTAIVRFDKPVQTRRSVKPGRENRSQYDDMLELGSGQESRSELLTGYAGLLVQGLARVADSGMVHRKDGQDPGVINETGMREAGAYRFCLWGAELLRTWLAEIALRLEDEGREGADRLRAAGAELVDGVTLWAGKHVKRAIEAERSGINHYLVTELLPRYLAMARRSAIKNHLGYVKVWEHEDRLRETDIKDALREAWRMGGVGKSGVDGTRLSIERPPSPLVVLIDQKRAGGDTDEGIVGLAVSGTLLYSWATSKDGRDAGVSKDVRHVGADAILAQVAEVSAKEIGSQRVIVGSEKQRIGYRLLSAEVVAQVLALSESDEMGTEDS